MEEERTEEQKVARAPIAIVLGGEPHDVAVLAICDSRVWRKEVVAALGLVRGFAAVTSDAPEEFKDALEAMLLGMPDKVVDLFFQYAKDLTRPEIEGVATDSEIAKGFEQMIEVSFPLASSLVGAMGRISA